MKSTTDQTFCKTCGILFVSGAKVSRTSYNNSRSIQNFQRLDVLVQSLSDKDSDVEVLNTIKTQGEHQYRNIKETYQLEKGSFDTVKKANFRATGERVAVKVLSKKQMTDEEKKATHNEIEILKQVDHPNIVKLIDVFEYERHWCLVTELMLGGELFD